MWIDRRYRSARGWFGRRSWRAKLILAAALFTSPCWCGCGGLFIRAEFIRQFLYTDEDRAFIRNERGNYPDAGGVPSIARRLKAEMESIPDPDTALQLHPDWAAARLGNGEWVFGYGINSHWISPGRGTLVLKDSRGQVRIFFGHVCGPNGGFDWIAQNIWNLDRFYTQLVAEGHIYREWVPPP